MVHEWILMIVLATAGTSSSGTIFETEKACKQAAFDINKRYVPKAHETIKCYKRFIR